jgi:diguanylate cyclase (GGDEF)-like protein/PAS domain S-box-containing protein
VAGVANRRFEPSRSRADYFTAAVESLPEHVAVLDPGGHIVAVNEAWKSFAEDNGAGGHPSLIEGADYLAAIHPFDSEAVAAGQGLRRVLAGELDEFRLDYPCHGPGELRWFELRATSLRHGTVDGVVVVHAPITERTLADQRLRYLASHDELTGLANRRHVFEVLEHTRASGRLGLLMVDLDHFKSVNDAHGHAAGNDVLCAVAEALDQPLPGGSLAGRHGGDEFCVLHFQSGPRELAAAAEELMLRAGDRLARLWVARSVSVSIGGTLVDADERISDAMCRADDALYAVKRRGRAGFQID